MKKKVFVTGANGMLGANIVRGLIQDGYDVHGLVFPGSNRSVLEGLDMSISEGDICSDLPLDDWLDGCFAIIHVAASTSIWPRRDPNVWKVNYDATLKIADAATRKGLERFVHIGTANSFDSGTKERPGREGESKYLAKKWGIDYMDSKQAVQIELLRRHKNEGFPLIVINPTFMIGPYDSGPTSGRLILNALEGNVPGSSSGGRSFVYTGDVARAAVNALHKGRLGECYLAAGENLSFDEFFRLVFERLGVTRRIIKVPQLFALIGGATLSIIGRINKKPPRLSFTMARMSYDDTYYSNQKAVDELDMPKTPLGQAIDECSQWLKENGYVKLGKGYAGKTIVITGSTQGVGKALAHRFLSHGANVVLNGRSEAKATALKDEFSYARTRMLYVPADVTSEEGAKKIVDRTMEQFDRIDVLINNAGMSSYGDLEDSDPKVIREVLNSNATGSLLVTHFALPYLRNTRGSVLFISSLAGLHGLGGHTIYSAAKMSLIGLAQGLSKEMKRHGVFVGYACLGFTKNDEVKRTLAPDGSLEPIPARPGIRPASQAYAVKMILKQLRKKRLRMVHTFPGKLLFVVSRISEAIPMFALKKGYDAERSFLTNLKKEKDQPAPSHAPSEATAQPSAERTMERAEAK